MPLERLQKIIAAAGIASRRKAEEMITQGRVSVNGQTVTELGSKADLEQDHIKVDGKLLREAERHVYLLLNKPKGYVTTVSDPEGRPTVMDLVKNVGARIYPVGRLDYSSEGLLLLTNDGELASHLMRAASHVPKTYLVKTSGRPAPDGLEKLRRGIRIGPKPGPRRAAPMHTAPAQIRLMKDATNPWYEVTLIEGKNRQIRRMFEEIGHHVEKIKRVRYGPLTLDVHPGEFRELTVKEVDALRHAKPGQIPAPPARDYSAGTKNRKTGSRGEQRRTNTSLPARKVSSAPLPSRKPSSASPLDRKFSSGAKRNGKTLHHSRPGASDERRRTSASPLSRKFTSSAERGGEAQHPQRPVSKSAGPRGPARKSWGKRNTGRSTPKRNG